MKILLPILLVLLAFPAIGRDLANYNSRGYSPSRNVAEQMMIAQMTVDTTATVVTLPRNKSSHSILLVNDDSTNSVWVEPGREVVLRETGTNASTTAGSVVLTLAEAKEGLLLGDLIQLTEGDANDGLYVIHAINGAALTLDRALAVTHTGTQNYLFDSFRVYPGEWYGADFGGSVVSFRAVSGTAAVRLVITFQAEPGRF